MLDQTGQGLDTNGPLRSQSQQLAERTFEQGGWTLAADAPVEVAIRLEGRTPTGLVHGMACKEWAHDADAKGEIPVIRTNNQSPNKI